MKYRVHMSTWIEAETEKAALALARRAYAGYEDHRITGGLDDGVGWGGVYGGDPVVRVAGGGGAQGVGGVGDYAAASVRYGSPSWSDIERLERRIAKLESVVEKLRKPEYFGPG